MAAQAKDGFGSKIGMILASAGSAVGLGNLLFVTGRVSAYGALFFIPYTILMLVMGLPLMAGEFGLGRKKQTDAISATEDAPSIGILGIIGSQIVMTFYFILGGAVIMTVFYAFRASDSDEIANYLFSVFGKGDGVQMNPVGLIASTLAFIGVNVYILWRGVGAGIEKVAKYAMPALLISLVGLMIYGIVAGDERSKIIDIFTKWKFDEANDPNGYGSVINVIGAAAAKAFLSLSVGMAVMITYGSYMKKEDDISSSSLWTILCDWGVVLIASISTIALGSWFAMPPVAVAFLMILVVIAALTSSISLMEAMIAAGIGRGLKRKQSVAFWGILIAVVSLIGLILLLTGALAWISAFDTLGEGYVFLLGGVFLSLYLGWKAKPWDEVGKWKPFYEITTKYIIPVMLLFLWLNSIGALGAMGINL